MSENDTTGNGVIARHLVAKTLTLAQRELSPTPADKARGRAALGLPLRLPEPAPTLTALNATPWAALQASGNIGALVSAALLGLGFGAGYWLGRTAEPQLETASESAGSANLGSSESNPSRAHAEASAGSQPEAGRNAALDEQSLRVKEPPAAEANAARGHELRRPGPDPSPRISRSSAELALMRRVERSLRNHEPALALGLLAELEARFPETGLEEERLAASVMAHCGVRDAGHGRRAEKFLESHPRSVYRMRIVSACSTEGAPGPHMHLATPDEGIREGGDE